MKKFIGVIICLLIIGMANNVKAGDWYFTLNASTYNLWSNAAIGAGMINRLNSYSGGYIGGEAGYYYDSFSIDNNDTEVSLKYPSFVGFKARDLFGNFDCGVKIGYQPQTSPIGVYGRVGYDKDYFMVSENQSLMSGKYKGDFLKIGGGVKFCSLQGRMSPYLELGTCYNLNVRGKTPYGNDHHQYNNGLEFNISVGGATYSDDIVHAVAFYADIRPYNYFKKDYLCRDGLNNFTPYEHTKTKNWNIGIKLTIYGFLSE